MITRKDVADKYKVSERTVDRWREEGMPFKKIGTIVRFEEVEVEKWIEEEK